MQVMDEAEADAVVEMMDGAVADAADKAYIKKRCFEIHSQTINLTTS
jgi:hypothetical protein